MRSEHTEPPVTISGESTEQYTRSGPELHRLVPPFYLQSAEGATVSPWDYKEKKNLILLFCDPRSSDDLGVLATLKGRYDAIADENAEVLAIASGPEEEIQECLASLELPFPVLSDSEGQVRELYAVTGPTMFIADKFGELRMRSEAGADFETMLTDAMTIIDLAELECPECGVRTWPVD